ncbi:MAG: 4-alpha-glucanotransferase [Treponema sp.]|jgi:4-alpha-glucanotransferase|nr:4-alpha-glucanotransferase [Treponema sp.]
MAEKNKNRRLIGTVVPVGALRSADSIGVGEFPDLAPFGALCAKMGIGLIQLLPVNDTGYQDSPYFALTAFALHPLYLKIGAMSEAGAFSDKLIKLGEEFNDKARFPYLALLRAKMGLLREIYDANKNEIAAKAGKGSSLGEWIEKNPWVKPYAVFRRLKEANGQKSWKEWESHVKPDAGEIHAIWENPAYKDEHLFWAWIQEALDRQFREAAAALAELDILLEGDLPILMNEDSCDVWAHPQIFHSELSAGAPPDMYSPDGQNWGFPIFNWEAQKKDDYSWWKARLKCAEKYYSAYRIDHVLGFFRIWASRREDVYYSSELGRFIPYIPILKEDLAELGFDSNRIRWMSEPHIPTGEILDAVRNNLDGESDESVIETVVNHVFHDVIDRIGDEELWRFKKSIRGSRDIEAMNIHPAAKNYLVKAWADRLFLEYENGKFFPTWYCKNSRSYASLSEEERENLEALLEKHAEASEKIWEKEGGHLLSVICAASSMLPCAEDLGAVPFCVPQTLEKLEILGLRVVRWHRKWNEQTQPYIPFEDYPELTVCTPAVHDSSTLREWWDREADQNQFSGFLGFPSLPKVYNPGTAKIILNRIAGAASRFRVFQIQDLLHLSNRWYAHDPASERINVPGTSNEFNWTWRLPALPEEIGRDEDLVKAVKELSEVKPAKKAPKNGRV